ncbi:hypothetical protein THRCLA_20883 [Thraustotheca clavata]|uniref:Uncharacterized protein n=1 Tax=Thraustotheca clavata TaxID=74557 RepID=A0A1W0A2D5_9STRA|nr:hypothetical protein THRCLA_20883 [Thraustotheca clavata]
MCAAALRSPEEWQNHPMAQHIANTYASDGNVPFAFNHFPSTIKTDLKSALGNASNCLSGLRVVSFTRVLAGPIAGRTLASHGADVLWVTAPHLPSLPNVDGDTSRGKRTIQLDLRKDDDAAKLKELLREADVFIDAYRPGALAKLGFDVSDVLELNPSMVIGRICAYGHTGPWGGKRGFDSLVQTATGINSAEAKAFNSATPRALPTQALDHASGYLLAFGVLAALYRKLCGISTGGDVVDVTLAWTGEWLKSLGAGNITNPSLSPEDTAAYSELIKLNNGATACFARRAPQMKPAPEFTRYPTSLASDEPVWLPRS